MPQDDPFAAFGGAAASSTPAQPQSTPQVPSSDPFAAFGGASSSSGVSSPAETATAAPAANDPFAAFGGSSVTPTNPVHFPDNSEQQPPPNEGLMAKVWRLANEPLTESIGGIPESRPGAGGLERGAEKVLSGFTSPLSLLLSIGTLGTAGFLESAGANVLKTTLMAGADGLDAAAATQKVEQFANAAKAAAEAFNTTGQPVSKAVEVAGMPYNEFRSLQSILYQSGLREADLTSGNIVQRGLFNAFAKSGITPQTAQKIAKWTELGLNTGFTAQQLDTAIHTIPKVQDLVKEGRYDDALEYAVEGGVGGIFGAIGAAHVLNSAKNLNLSINEVSKFKPSDENQKVRDTIGERDLAIQTGNQNAANWREGIYKDIGVKGYDSKLGLDKIFETKAEREKFKQDNLARYLALGTGNDPELARQAGNALAEAIDRPDKVMPPPEGTNPPQHPGLPENLPEWVHDAKLTDRQKAALAPVIDAYHAVANGLSDKELSVFQKLRDADDDNWDFGNKNGLLPSKIENHIHQIWGPDEKDVGGDLIQEARTGRLDTNVTQARHRTFNSVLEGLLKGKNLPDEGIDPMAIIALDRTALMKAAANREFIKTIRDNNVRGSDGRPMVVLNGEGHVVAGDGGKNASAFISPNRIQDIGIKDDEVARMQTTGELNRFINRGDIIDVTKYARPDNIDDFINLFEKHAMSQEAKYDPEGNNILRQKIAILKGVKDGTLPASELDKINSDIKPFYKWHPQDYITPDSKALRAWNWVAKTDDGTNLMVQADMRLHPEVANYIINALGLDDSYLRDNTKGIGKITKPILTGAGEAKKILLSGSLFHLQQEALRALMVGVNPLKIDPIADLASSPKLQKAVREGLTLVPDKTSFKEHSEGLAEHSKILSKIPVVGKFFDWYQNFLFNRVIPSYKARATERMWDKYQSAHPDWDDRGIAKAVAEHVNNAFGGQNWRAMGRAAATQDWFHILALAPDWLESEMRFAASTVRGGLSGKNFTGRQVAQMAMGMWGLARVLNLTTTGNMHLEAPFGLATKDKDGREIVYSMRTMPADILHMASHPMEFLRGRLSPFARIGQEYISGNDQFGRKLSPGDMWVDIARNMAPIPAQAIGQIAAGDSPSVGNIGQLIKSAGGTATLYRTEAEKLAANLASENSESGPMDPQKLRRHEALVKFEDDIRAGRMTMQQLANERDFGDLNQTEYKQIKDNVKLTAGQDPTTARMISHASRLGVGDALKVWDEATPQEKIALTPVLKKKQQDYMRKAYKDMTPQQRLNDNLFRRLRLMTLEQPTETEQ
jgi:hypothetical protein